MTKRTKAPLRGDVVPMPVNDGRVTITGPDGHVNTYRVTIRHDGTLLLANEYRSFADLRITRAP